jgi:hypothetical protein
MSLHLGAKNAALHGCEAATGTLNWTKGIVLPESCTRRADAHVCQVELVPSGRQVAAQSDAAVAGGDWVKLRVWRNVVSGTDTYTVVQGY